MRNRFAIIIGALLASSGPVGCAGGGSENDTGSGGGAGGVQRTLDTANAVSADIDEQGGTLSVTATDGTWYYLSIPANALLSPERITMTPIASASGLPFSGGLVGGVQLEPDGLSFLRPVRLEIHPPGAFDPITTTGFRWHGAGTGLHLAVSTPDAYKVAMDLLHFSAAGAASATAADVETQRDRGASTAEDGYQQRLAASVELAKRAGKSISDPDVLAELDAVFQEWWTNSVQPNLAAGETDDAVFDSAAEEFFRWDRQRALLGFPPQLGDPASPGMISLKKGLRNAFDQARARCVTDSDLGQVPLMFRRAKEAVLLSIDIGYTQPQIVGAVQGCVRFDVTFNSSTRGEDTGGYWATSAVRSTFVVTPSSDLLRLEGAGQITYLAYDDVNSADSYLETVFGSGQMALRGSFIRLNTVEGAAASVSLTLGLAVVTSPTVDITYVDKLDGFRVHWGAPFYGWRTSWTSAHTDRAWDTNGDAFFPYLLEGAGPVLHRVSDWLALDPYSGGVTTFTANDIVDAIHAPIP